MLEAKNINIRLRKTDKNIIENFNFTLNSGDVAVIIGEEGNGKLTLLKSIYNSKLIEKYCEFEGNIITKSTCGYLPQMLDEKYLKMTVNEYFANVNINHSILVQLNLKSEFISSPQIIKTLSGGEKIKTALAKILMQNPDILLLDEPTNDLDIKALTWLEQFINTCRKPVLFISHDELLIEKTANTIIHLEQIIRKTKSRITISRMNYSDYIEFRNLKFNKQMQMAKGQRADYEKKMEKLTLIYNRVHHEQNTISRADPGGARLLKKKMKAVKSQEKRINKNAEDFTDIPQQEQSILTKFSEDIFIPSTKEILNLNINSLSVEHKILSENINLLVIGNQHIGIIGENGVGKSTLLKVIYENLKSRNDIVLGYMPQDYSEKLDYEKSPIEILAENYSKEDITKARQYMGSMKFTHEEMTGKTKNLSGGQKAKLIFLEMVLKNANVLLLDEPTRNFSPLSVPVIRETLTNFKSCIISISHDRKYLQQVCNKVYELTKSGITEI